MLLRESFKRLAQVFDACTATTNHHAGLGGVNKDPHNIPGALNYHLTYSGGKEFFFDVAANLEVLKEQVGVVLISIPLGVPVPDYANAKSLGMYFLTHAAIPPIFP